MNTPAPIDAPLPMVDWGTGWVVVDKPAGLSVHNEPGKDVCSRLVQYLITRCTEIAVHELDYGLHPVHRLDKETSGILLLAGQPDLFGFFAEQMARGKARKEYLALVHGQVPSRKPEKTELWQWPLTKAAAGRKNPQGHGSRVPCHTRFRVLQTSRHYALLRCRLLTGRSHQIRRHAALAGHPVLGDRRYGSKRACRYLEQRFNFTRLGLHSALLEIQLPGEQGPRCFVPFRQACMNSFKN